MTEEQEPGLRAKLREKAPQLIAGAVATVIIAGLSSYLGTAGTVVGLVLASAGIGALTAVLEHGMGRSARAAKAERERIRKRLEQAGIRVRDPYAHLYRKQRRSIPWRLMIASAGAVAVLSGCTLGVVAAITGRAPAAIVQNAPAPATSTPGQESSTTPASSSTTHHRRRHPAARATSPSVSPAQSTGVSSTPTTSPVPSPSPSPSPPPSPPPSPSPDPTPG